MSLKSLRSLVALGCLLVCTISSQHLLAQSEPADPESYIVRIDGLNPTDYATVVKALRAEGKTSVSEACIPTGLIVMKTPSGWSRAQSVDQVQSVVSTKTDLAAEYLSAYTMNEFREACNDARLGRSGK